MEDVYMLSDAMILTKIGGHLKALTGRTSGNPIESLCFLGKRCMGALAFEPAIDTGYDPQHRFEIDSLVEVAREALDAKSEFGVNLNDDRKAAIAEILRLGTSAGGQRAKAIIAYNKAYGCRIYPSA